MAMILESTSDSIDLLANAILQDEAVALPTDTLFALCVNPCSQKAMDHAFEIKKRMLDKQLPVFVNSIEMAESICELSDPVIAFLKSVWPGKVTAIMKLRYNHPLAKDFFPGTVALRMPKFEAIIDVINKTNCPITGTSVNISGEPSVRSVLEIREKFRDIKYVLNGEIDIDAKPSTIVDLINGAIIRQGEVSIQKLP